MLGALGHAVVHASVPSPLASWAIFLLLSTEHWHVNYLPGMCNLSRRHPLSDFIWQALSFSLINEKCRSPERLSKVSTANAICLQSQSSGISEEAWRSYHHPRPLLPFNSNQSGALGTFGHLLGLFSGNYTSWLTQPWLSCLFLLLR